LELDGRDQSASGGPFMWTRHASSRVLLVNGPDEGLARWHGAHDGYSGRGRPVIHLRSVELDRASRELRVLDKVLGQGTHQGRLAFHLGPRVAVDLAGGTARLSWTNAGSAHSAVLHLPAQLTWTAHRGEIDPPLGWYSPGFGRREPAVTLLGRGVTDSQQTLATVLRFDQADAAV
jgi:hypothetical protein